MHKKIDDIKAERLWFEGKTDYEIAEIFGITPESFGKWRKNHNLPSNKNLFQWQTCLSQNEQEKIPQRYRREKHHENNTAIRQYRD